MILQPKLTLRAFYFATWWALVVLTFLNGIVSGICPLPLILIAFPFCAVSLVPRWARWSQGRGGPLMVAFLALVLPLEIYQYRIDRNIVTLIGGGLLAFLPLALHRKREPRGNWMALLLVFLLSQVSVLVGEDATEFLLFILFSLAFVLNLNAAHLYFHLGAFESTRTPVPRNYFPSFFYSTGLGLLLALGLFFLFPRSIQWVNPFGMRQKDRVTGYTGTVSLDGKSLLESSEIALRVESKDTEWLSREGPGLYFRGNTVEQFDGVRWRPAPSHVARYLGARRLAYTTAAESRVRFLKIYREPSEGSWVFYPGLLREIVGPASFRNRLRFDEQGNLSRPSQESDRYAYEIGVSLLTPAPEELGELTVSEVHADLKKNWRRYLGPAGLGPEPERFFRLPDSVKNGAFFSDWMREVGVQPKRATLDDVRVALLREFHARYKSTYEHEMPSTGSFEYFLRRGRAGHCEYFATAAALYLRAVGIPSRVVLGYRGGTFNSVAGILEVKESNAHAWVEFFVPRLGWITFDPTPVKVVVEVPSAWDYLSFYSSAMRFWFERYVVQYNQETQVQLFKQLTTWSKTHSSGKSSLWHLGSAHWLWLLLLLAGARAAILLRRRRRRAGARVAELPRYYRQFQRRMRAKGLERAAGETYSGFHSRLRAAKVGGDLVDRIDRALESELYSPNPPSAEEREEILRALRS